MSCKVEALSMGKYARPDSQPNECVPNRRILACHRRWVITPVINIYWPTSILYKRRPSAGHDRIPVLIKNAYCWHIIILLLCNIHRASEHAVMLDISLWVYHEPYSWTMGIIPERNAIDELNVISGGIARLESICEEHIITTITKRTVEAHQHFEHSGFSYLTRLARSSLGCLSLLADSG